MALQISYDIISDSTFLRWHLCRPERMNAIGTTFAQELSAALSQIKGNPELSVRALVISAEVVTKNGRDVWIAGGDLKELSQLPSASEARSYAATMRRVCAELELLPFPVITFINGAAIGGGAELALAADIRLGTPAAAFEWKQLKLGLSTGYGAAARLCSLIGKAQAQRLLFLCESVLATEAVNLGLLHKLLESPEDLQTFLSKIARIDPAALNVQKRMLHLATSSPAGDQRLVDDLFQSLWRNPSHERALDEFLGRQNKTLVLEDP